MFCLQSYKILLRSQICEHIFTNKFYEICLSKQKGCKFIIYVTVFFYLCTETSYLAKNYVQILSALRKK